MNNQGDLAKESILKTYIRTFSKVYKLDTFRFRKETDRILFTKRAVDEWNKASRYVAQTNMIEGFK